MPSRLALLLVALFIAANSTASNQRTLNLLRGSEAIIGVELQISDTCYG